MAAPQAGSPPSSMAGPPSSNPDFPIPAAKRPRLSPQPAAAFPQAQGAPSQHVSPYANPSPSQSAPPTPSLYNGTSASPRYNHTPSPHFSNAPSSQTTYTTPYSNGSTPAPTSIMNSNPQFSTSNSQPNFTSSPYARPANYGATNSQNHQTNNQFASQHNSYNPSTQNNINNMAGNMGPPMKPPEKPEADEDHTDILTGTGVNLREEEAYSQGQFAFSQNTTGSQSSAFSSQNYPPYTAGPEGAFYGSGLASQPAENTGGHSQEYWEKKAAEDAWHAAAHKVAQSRQEELANPFSQPIFMMKKMDRIASALQIRINLQSDLSMGQLIVPNKDYDLETSVTTRAAGGSAMMATNGRILPVNSLVVDQLILLSLATKQRTRQLLEEAVKLAKGRQVGSSGFVPPEWSDLAVPANGADGTIVSMDPETARIGWESAVSPRSNPLKRTNSSANRLPTPISDGTKTPVPSKSFTNDLAKALRDAADTERQHEEERLKKRIARKEGTLRNGSIAPGTPGSVASSSGTPAVKPPTRKELEKKTKEKKKEDAASNISANATSSMFLGKKKKYDWMNSGSASNNAAAAYSLKTATGVRAVAPVIEGPIELTQRGQQRIGNWREDKSSGDKVQLRDWVAVLELDGGSSKELQRALTWLDGNTRPQER